MKKAVTLAALCALLVLCPKAGFAQKSNGEVHALKQELESLKEGQKAIQKELEEIKNLLRAKQAAGIGAAPAAPPNTTLNVDGYPSKGEPGARLTLVEYSDYQCPFCGRHIRDTFPQIERDYIKTGKIKYVFKDLPLVSIHPQALKAAEGAACAAEQGKYWEMHEQLFNNQRALGSSELSLHAQAVGINVLSFQQCLFSGKHAGRINQSMAEAQDSGISGTPTIVLGLSSPEDASKVKVITVISGARPYSDFKAAIDAALEASK